MFFLHTCNHQDDFSLFSAIPTCGNLITFSQFLFISCEGLITTSKFFTVPPKIPIRLVLSLSLFSALTPWKYFLFYGSEIICRGTALLIFQELPGYGGLFLPRPGGKQCLLHVPCVHTSPDDISSCKYLGSIDIIL